MELCAGGSVTDLLESMAKKHETPSLSEEEIAYIVAEVCNALVYLHGHCRIHRDVKGNNILLTETGLENYLSDQRSKGLLQIFLLHCLDCQEHTRFYTAKIIGMIAIRRICGHD